MIENIKRLLWEFWADEEAATAVEYAIMLVLIIAVVVGVVAVLGKKTTNSFDKFNSEFTKAAGS